MTIEEIRELIKVVTETGVAELEVQRGEDRVRIVRSAGGSMMQHVVVPAVTSPMAAPASHPEARRRRRGSVPGGREVPHRGDVL